MAETCVVILEDESARRQAMTAVIAELLPEADLEIFESAHAMLSWLQSNLGRVVLIALDHDLPIRRDANHELIDFGDGRVLTAALSNMPVTAPVIVHTSNADARAQMAQQLRDAGWPVTVVVPFDDTHWIRHEWTDAVRSSKAAGWFDPPKATARPDMATVSDVEGPWVDPDFESGLIERCKAGWNTPVTELTNAQLATYLRQKIALSLIVPEAQKRITANVVDDSEFYDELSNALKTAVGLST